jgi:hypothetical protein
MINLAQAVSIPQSSVDFLQTDDGGIEAFKDGCDPAGVTAPIFSNTPMDIIRRYGEVPC